MTCHIRDMLEIDKATDRTSDGAVSVTRCIVWKSHPSTAAGYRSAFCQILSLFNTFGPAGLKLIPKLYNFDLLFVLIRFSSFCFSPADSDYSFPLIDLSLPFPSIPFVLSSAPSSAKFPFTKQLCGRKPN